ncbi:Mut7-C RNAse domain-containing protein [Cognatilysobacter segetis]|uniref:Mut7-C RNAse domain-containing protein n=1 Tax=Cognatilysobacter segetis TaxID=2492394 RepID=UPI00105F2003|nr:Mut7-C RNAse domain-containing protein [Lysobacter segetis]
MPRSTASPRHLRLRVHGRLARFLSPARRGGDVEIPIDGTHGVKDPIESIGIPHVEVAAVEVDGERRPLAHRVHGGETVDVYPVERQSIDLPPRFVLDAHLGRLARYLRLAGIDTAYSALARDDVLREAAQAGRRVLLTRDVALLKRGDVDDAAFVYAVAPVEQFAEICARFGLDRSFAPFTRCARCNGRLEPVDAAGVADDVPTRVLQAVERFSRCTECGQVYWPGTHESRLRARLALAGVHLP